MNEKTKKFLITAAKILAVAVSLSVAIVLLQKYEYLSSITAVDNIVGAVPIAMMTMFVFSVAALAFMNERKRKLPLCIFLSVIIVLSVALYPKALRADWWIRQPSVKGGESADISVYEPFKAGNKTAKLDEDSGLKLFENLPVMDGALALYPVYAAIAESVYEESAVKDEIMFTNTLKAFDAVIAGERDVIFCASASENQRKAAEKAGAELVFTPIGKEAFVFLVGKDNPLDGLSKQQIKNIYSGKTAKWKTLGFAEGGDIVAFRRPDGSGSETGLQSIMKDVPLISPQPLPDKSLAESNSLMTQISAEYKGVQPALGYSYKFFATVMYPNPNCKVLKIDGVYPSADNIKSGKYPYTVKFYAITRGQPSGNTKKLIDWILSPVGQRLIEKCGYAPV